MSAAQNHPSGGYVENEASPLFRGDYNVRTSRKGSGTMTRKIVRTNLLLLFIAALVYFLVFAHLFNDKIGPWTGKLPKDPHKAALVIMQQAPVIVRTVSVSGFHQTDGMEGRAHWSASL